MLRSSNLGPDTFRPVPAAFTNWRDEVRAWKDSCALLEQSCHMTELHLRGSEIIPLLSMIAVNKLDTFPVMRAKQLVLAGHGGYMIADAIVFREAEDFCRTVGAPFATGRSAVPDADRRTEYGNRRHRLEPSAGRPAADAG